MTQRFILKVEDQTKVLAINGKSFQFRFYAFRDLMYVDISQAARNGDNSIVNGKRIMANRWLLPNYVAEGIGNIRFETYEADGDDYVWYEGFNTKFRLVSYTDAEIKQIEEEEEQEG
jgi:hypothetical protein